MTTPPLKKPTPEAFNPVLTQDALKAWWGNRIKLANKTVKAR